MSFSAHLFIRDGRRSWGRALQVAATRRGWKPHIIVSTEEIDQEGFGFIRTHANPDVLPRDRRLGQEMCRRLNMVQDEAQIVCYDDKREQFRRWSDWMPDTWLFESCVPALAFLEEAPYPLVSKADVGASSRNVRILKDKAEAIRHVREAFGPGILVEHCSGDGAKSFQRGYVLLQRFVPHDITYRVNVIGNQRAIFHRFCYPDRPVAQTGNVEPVYRLDSFGEDLLDYAEGFVRQTGTRWCALDILRDGPTWRLLETSLAWPHPSPGDCNNGTFFPSGRKWIAMWDVLLDEMERW